MSYFKWLWKSLRCKHEPGEWVLHNLGLTKVRFCKKCDAYLGERYTRKEMKERNPNG